MYTWLVWISLAATRDTWKYPQIRYQKDVTWQVRRSLPLCTVTHSNLLVIYLLFSCTWEYVAYTVEWSDLRVVSIILYLTVTNTFSATTVILSEKLTFHFDRTNVLQWEMVVLQCRYAMVTPSQKWSITYYGLFTYEIIKVWYHWANEMQRQWRIKVL